MAIAKNYFILDGVDSRDFGVYLYRKQVLSSPARRVETITVPGRNGALVRDEKAYENLTQVYDAIIIKDAQTGMRDLKNFLLTREGYVRLEDTFDAEEYYMARLLTGIDVVATPQLDKMRCVLEFDRKPQRFLKIGEEVKEFTASGTLENPTYNNALPLIRIYGNGTVTVNGRQVRVSNNSGDYVDVDCEKQDAYKGNTNRNADIELLTNAEFPELGLGTNSISKTSGVSRVEITPRWWRL